MRKKCILIITCLITSYLSAYENDIVENTPQNTNRYQMQVSYSDVGNLNCIAVLDTENGTVWVARNDYYLGWVWKKLPPLPQQE